MRFDDCMRLLRIFFSTIATDTSMQTILYCLDGNVFTQYHILTQCRNKTHFRVFFHYFNDFDKINHSTQKSTERKLFMEYLSINNILCNL